MRIQFVQEEWQLILELFFAENQWLGARGEEGGEVGSVGSGGRESHVWCVGGRYVSRRCQIWDGRR